MTAPDGLDLDTGNTGAGGRPDSRPVGDDRGAQADHAALVAMRSVYVVFFGAGLGFASWASRIPQVRDHLHISPASLGLLLLCVALGSLVALPTAGLVIQRLGEARTVTVTSLVLALGLATVAVGYQFGAVPVGVGLMLLGFGNGNWDVAMNVQGAAVEQRIGRTIMSRFHAGFSLGTVAGAGIGALMVWASVSVTVHLAAIAILIAVSVPTATRWFIPSVVHAEPAPGTAGADRHPMAAWTEPRTLVIGLFVLCMAFTEGAGNDWLGVAVIDGYHSRAVIGTLTFAVFLAAMTLGRWFGPGVVDRYGRVPTLRVSAIVALAGLITVVVGHVVALAMLGALLWGLGAALGFPTGMSAASDDARLAPARVSVVASVGYVAFLAGPPLIGLLGDRLGVLRALLVGAVLLVIAVFASPALAVLRPVVAPGSDATSSGRLGTDSVTDATR